MKGSYFMIQEINQIKEHVNGLYFNIYNSYKVTIPAIILLIIGLFLIFYSIFSDTILFKNNPPITNHFISDIKIGLIFFFLGIYILLFFPENARKQHTEIYIFFFLTGWLFFVSFITIQTRTTFFLYNAAGSFICKELVNGYLTPLLKKKLTIMTLVFFSTCMIIVTVKIINDFYLFP